jgi:hypothetical protein
VVEMKPVLVCLSVIALTGCGANGGVAHDDCPDRSYRVEEVVRDRPSGVFEVEGYIVSEGGETRLCSALLESHPPQCGATSIRLGEPAPQGDGVRTAEGVTWTEEEQRVLGQFKNDAFLRVGCV